MTDPRLGKIEEIAKRKYDHGDPSHDFVHVQRVVGTAVALGREEGADLSVLIPAAYLHDVVNVPKDHPDRVNASRMAAEEARAILDGCGYSAAEIARIQEAIVEHSYSLGRAPSSLESAILQDADRLDALGAIGVMRMVTVGSRLGRSFYQPGDAFAENRALDDKTYTIDHFWTKLLKLEEKMNTASGKREAEKRTLFMRSFLDQLGTEIATKG